MTRPGKEAARAVVLVLNSGSSSLKYAAFNLAAPEAGPIVSGQVDPGREEEAFGAVDRELVEAGASPPTAIGHRIVHGGPRLLEHRRIDPWVVGQLERAAMFAPSHMPAALALLRRAQARYPCAAQVACFDTAFHAGMPDIARTLPLPHAVRDAGVHRYGFHGLSCASIVHRLGDALPPRVVIAHLGHGASVTAVQDGRSVDTSMGLTPSGGVVMGTRTGDIDPGVLLHLMRTCGRGASELEEMVARRSGMLGISGVSGDMRVLQASPEPDAGLAIRIFRRSVAKQIAGMLVTLGGADLLVFTGGIGENDEATRRAVCDDLSWAGVTIDEPRGAGERGCLVITVPAREEEQIARDVGAIIAAQRTPSSGRAVD